MLPSRSSISRKDAVPLFLTFLCEKQYSNSHHVVEWQPMARLKILDWLVLLISITVFTGSIFWSAVGREGELRVEIEAFGEHFVLPLAQDGSLLLDGPIGQTRVEVKSGAVSISDSDCRDKLCVAMGQIASPSAWVACLPNRVFVRLATVASEDVQSSGVDSVAF